MLDFAAIAAGLRRNSESICRTILPGGKRRGNEWVCGGLDGSPGESLSVNLKEGVWKDFATGEGGADLINLIAASLGVTQLEAARRGAGHLGMDIEEIEPRPRGPFSRPSDFLKAPVQEEIEATPDGDEYWWQSATPTHVWQYLTQDGELVQEVYRFQRGDEKVVRPWNPKKGRWEAALKEGRPLLYLADIRKAKPGEWVVVTEGEKAADAVREAGFIATTNQGGAQAVALTDWSALEGRRVVYWRDKDTGGRHSREKVLDLLRRADVAACVLVDPPEDAEVGFDAADAELEARRALVSAAIKSRPVITGKQRLILGEWTADRFKGVAPPMEYLVEGVFPLGAPVMLAGMGDIGKGMLGLDFAFRVATGEPSLGNPPMAFGGRILHFGRTVVLAGEDDLRSLHYRLGRIDPEGKREKAGDRFILVPLPNAGGNYPLLRQSGRGLEITDQFDKLRDELAALPDLKLVIIDPLARFAAAQIERETDAGQMLLGALGSLAAELNCTVMLSHHMAKTRGKEQRVNDAAGARELIRGGTNLVDGVRAAYALWPELDASRARAELERRGIAAAGDDWRGKIVYGAVVKANGPHDKTVRTYTREESGLLVDATFDDSGQRVTPVELQRMDAEPLLPLLVELIKTAAATGQPYTRTRTYTSLESHPEELPDELFNACGKEDLRDLVDAALDQKLIVKCTAGGTEAKWLDAPDGPFAAGTGSFKTGRRDMTHHTREKQVLARRKRKKGRR